MRFAALLAVLAFGAAIPAIAAAPATRSALVLVSAPAADGRTAFASGVIVDTTSGLSVVTAGHIAALAGLRIETQSGESLQVLRVRFIDGYDLAVLQTGLTRDTYAPARASAAVAENQRAQVWGYGDQGAPRMVEAVVLDARTVFPNNPGIPKLALACDRCEHGDSGAGVFAGDGSLIGVIVSRWHDGANRLSVMEAEPAAALDAVMASK